MTDDEVRHYSRFLGYGIGACIIAAIAWAASWLVWWLWSAVANPGYEVSQSSWFAIIASMWIGRAVWNVATRD